MTRPSLAVIKVGGSLFDWPDLSCRLSAYLESRLLKAGGEQAVLIAGGGSAADWIRALDQTHRLGDAVAHGLALHALDLTAATLAALLPGSLTIDRLESLEAARNSRTMIILAPRRVLAEIERQGASPLRASWEVTSDTIAARIAVHLEARSLILLKSAPLPDGAAREDAARLGLVDPMLPSAARLIPEVEYVNLRSHAFDCRILSP